MSAFLLFATASGMFLAAVSALAFLGAAAAHATGLRRFAGRTLRRLGAAAGASYGAVSLAFLGVWGLGTNVSWAFVAFVTVAWPWWMVAGWTGAGWMTSWMPGGFFVLR